MRSRFLAMILCAAAVPLLAADDAILQIPPMKSSLDVKGKPVSITASGTISRSQKAWGQDAYRIKLNADLSDLRQHLTEILKAQLNRSDRCGETLEIQQATLTPAEPSGMLTAHLHYERSVCAKAFGRQINKRMVAGNGVVEVKLTPTVEANKTVRLIPEVGRIEADGSLGEMLRSGSLGDKIREKIEESLMTSIQKAANMNSTLPPSIQDRVSLENARFTDGGSGQLAVVVTGDVKITAEQAKSLAAVLARRAN